ncbi:flagellar filament capping protein FliD [Rossellomorea marisflavi]
MRVGGLASGMDIDSIVADLMKAERMPLSKLKQQKQIIEWKRDDYRLINTLLLDFRSELTQFKLSSKYRSRVTATSDETKVTASATNGAAQGSFTINNVTRLASAATRISGSSGANGEKISGTGKTFNPASSLFGQTDNLDNGSTFVWGEGVVDKQTLKTSSDTNSISLELSGTSIKDIAKTSVKVNGKAFEVVTSVPPEGLNADQVLVDENGTLSFGTTMKKDTSIQVDYIAESKTQAFPAVDKKVSDIQLAKGSIQSLILTIEGKDYSLGQTGEDGKTELKAADSSIIGYIDKQNGKINFTESLPEKTTISANYTQNYTDFSVTIHGKNGKQVTNFLIQGNESLNTIINRVNTSGSGASMLYDAYSDRMTLSRTETGDFNKTGNEISTSGAFLNSLMKFENSTETGGTNVEFEINGLKTERTSNTFEMNGVTFTIKDLFNSSTMPNGVTTSVQNSTDDVFNNIKGLIDQYNTLIGVINGKTNEDRYKSYSPLTDEQRESLTDKQQEQWEEKARSGLLKRDSTLTSVVSQMRMNFYQPVDSVEANSIYRQLASIGITTTSNYREGGKLVIDEAKLKKAIENDPASVENLFKGGSSATDPAQQGIVHRLYNTVNGAMDKLKAKAGGANSTNQQFTLGKDLNNVDQRISSFELKMKQVEDRYWRQFTAMEKAIQKANSQSAYLMQQFSM